MLLISYTRVIYITRKQHLWSSILLIRSHQLSNPCLLQLRIPTESSLSYGEPTTWYIFLRSYQNTVEVMVVVITYNKDIPADENWHVLATSLQCVSIDPILIGVYPVKLMYVEGWRGWYSRDPSSISGYNHVSLGSISSGAPISELCCTRSVQLRGIVPSLINGTVENSSSNTICNWGEKWPVSGLRTRSTDPPQNGDWTR